MPSLAVPTMPFELGSDMEVVQEKCVPFTRESWPLLVFSYGIAEGPELVLRIQWISGGGLFFFLVMGGVVWVWKYMYLSYLGNVFFYNKVG